MSAPGKFDRYLIEEFYDDYREGTMSRRGFIRRVAFITGSMAAAAVAMSAVGCSDDELPAADEPMPTPEPGSSVATVAPSATRAAEAATVTATAATAATAVGARSPLSVGEGDPAVRAQRVTFPSGGDTIAGYLARPSAAGTFPAVLVCHENRGLVPHIEDVTRRFAKEGYAALAIDLLAREGGTAAQDPTQAPALLTAGGEARHVGDFAAGLAYLRTLEGVADDRIAMTGYCFGGGITWEAATRLPDLKAVAAFYGPAPEPADVPNIRAAAFGVYGETDARITGGAAALESALAAAGVTHLIRVYPGVGHAFHNDTGNNYNQEQATRAWQDTLSWFGTHV